MSLLVRLPLNGNLNNYGSADVTVTNNGATISNDGKLGKCYSFDGNDDYIDFGTTLNSVLKGGNNPFTISFWIKSFENATRGVIFSSYGLSSTSEFFSLEINSGSVTSNSLRFDWRGEDIKYFTGAVTYNTWVNLTVTYDGTVIKCYQNGILFNSITKTLDTLNGTNKYYLGRDSRTGTTALNGRLNDFRIYDNALTESEIKHLIRGKGLQIWLPLNGDLIQQGLSNATVTNVGATVDNAGKIGKCYSFDGSDDGIRIDGDILSQLQQGDFTIAFWAYSNDSGDRSIYIATTPASDWGFSIEKTTSEKLRVYWQNSPDFNTTTFNVPNQEWFHVAMVINNGNCYCYKNGEKVAERTSGDMTPAKLSRTWVYAQLGRDTRTGSTVLNGKMNDFRWYDYALSEKEVKEIAKGLVLHYKLSGAGGENLFGYGSNCISVSGFTQSTNLFSVVTEDGKTCAHVNGQLKTTAYLGSKVAFIPQPNEVCTFSAEVKVKNIVAGTTNAFLALYFSGQTIDGTWRTAGSYIKKVDGIVQGTQTTTLMDLIPDEWHHVSITGTYADANFTINCLPAVYARDFTGEMWIRNIKFERGDKATPWCPNSADTEYTTMGYDNNIEYDLSGYKNNGTKTGTLSYTTDTPRYQASTHIGSTNQKIHISNFPTSGFGDSYSFAWWGKRNSNSPMFWGFSDGIRLNGMYGGTLWNTGDSSNNPIYKPGTTTKITAPSIDVWHHYVMTGDGTTCKLYLDGELYGQAKTYKSISGTSIYINGWDSGTQYCSDNTDISDFRIYATALSADDIAELYNGGVL